MTGPPGASSVAGSRWISRDPPAVVLRGFAGAELCRQVAALADDLYLAEKMFRNVFQGNAWVANLDPPSARPSASDPRWKLVEGLRQEVLSGLRMERWLEDDYLGNFISYMTDGGFVIRHRDDWQIESPDRECRVRCNLFVQKQPGSGDPCLGPEGAAVREERLDVATGDLLVFSPTLTLHRATRVRGAPRVMVSFGVLASVASFESLVARLGEAPG